MRTLSLPMEELVKVILLQLEESGIAFLTVTGSSMHPTFRHRLDRVHLVRRQPVRGDVILYKRDNGDYVLHRIVKTEENYICSGDNQWQPEPVRPDQVIAVVNGFDRKETYYSLNHRGYRLWARLWTELFPVRRPILTVRHGLGKLIRRIKK